MRARHLSAFVAIVLLLPAAGAEAGPWLPQPGQFYSEFSARRFVTDRFRNGAGDQEYFPLGLELESRALESYNEIGWKNRWSIVLGVPLLSETARPGSTLGEATQTGFGDLLFGVRRGLLTGGHALAIEADWLAPLGYDRKGFPPLGDGQQKLGGQAILGTSLPSLHGFIEASGGALYLFEDEGTQSFARAVAAFWVGGSLLLVGTYEGVFADLATVHAAGPEMRVRVDSRLDVFAGSRHTLAGENVSDTNEIYVGMAFKKTDLNRLQGFLGGSSRP